MKATLISMLIVAALAAGICVFSVLLIGNISDEMEEMRISVLELIDADDRAGALRKLGQMKEAWSGHEDALAILASHDDIHEITELIIESGAYLEAGDTNDFSRSMELLGEAIGHLRREERPSLANVL